MKRIKKIISKTRKSNLYFIGVPLFFYASLLINACNTDLTQKDDYPEIEHSSGTDLNIPNNNSSTKTSDENIQDNPLENEINIEDKNDTKPKNNEQQNPNDIITEDLNKNESSEEFEDQIEGLINEIEPGSVQENKLQNKNTTDTQEKTKNIIGNDQDNKKQNSSPKNKPTNITIGENDKNKNKQLELFDELPDDQVRNSPLNERLSKINLPTVLDFKNEDSKRSRLARQHGIVLDTATSINSLKNICSTDSMSSVTSDQVEFNKENEGEGRPTLRNQTTSEVKRSIKRLSIAKPNRNESDNQYSSSMSSIDLNNIHVNDNYNPSPNKLDPINSVIPISNRTININENAPSPFGIIENNNNQKTKMDQEQMIISEDLKLLAINLRNKNPKCILDKNPTDLRFIPSNYNNLDIGKDNLPFNDILSVEKMNKWVCAGTVEVAELIITITHNNKTAVIIWKYDKGKERIHKRKWICDIKNSELINYFKDLEF